MNDATAVLTDEWADWASRDPCGQAEQNELGLALAAALDSLPENLRTVTAMHYLAGCKVADIALRLDITEAAVKMRTMAEFTRLSDPAVAGADKARNGLLIVPLGP